MIGGGFLGGGISIVPAGKAIIYASMTTEDGANIPNAVFKAVRTGSTVTANGGVDGRAELLVDAGHTYTVTVTPAGGSYLNNSQTVVAASAKSYAVKFYLYPAKANEASTTASLNTLNTSISTHAGNTSNPHAVTKAQVGLGNVNNTSDANKPVSTATNTELAKKVAIAQGSGNASKFALTDASGNLNTFRTLTATDIPNLNASKITAGTLADARIPTTIARSAEVTAHTDNKSNPHSVTKAQVGLGNVDNTSDVNKPISTATQTALNGKVNKTGNEEIAGVKTFLNGVYQKSTQDIGVAGYRHRHISRLADVNDEVLFVDMISKESNKGTGRKVTLANKDSSGTYFSNQRVEFLEEDGLYREYIIPPSGPWVLYRTLNADGTGYSSTPMRASPGSSDSATVKYVLDRVSEMVVYVKMYHHSVRVYAGDSKTISVSLGIVNSSSTPITSVNALRDYIGSEANDYYPCSGMVWTEDKATACVATGIRGNKTASTFKVMGVNMSSGGGTYSVNVDVSSYAITVTDNVREIL